MAPMCDSLLRTAGVAALLLVSSVSAFSPALRLQSSPPLVAVSQRATPATMVPIRIPTSLAMLGSSDSPQKNFEDEEAFLRYEEKSGHFPSLSTLVKTVGIAGAVLAMSSSPALATSLPDVSLAVGVGAPVGLVESIRQTGFYQAFSLVFLSEIGDKTFFIAGLLAMKTSKLVSFVGSLAALSAMTVLSCVIGQVFNAVPSGFSNGLPLDDIAAVLAFTFFGFKTLKEAYDIEEGESVMDEELADAEEAVDGSDTIKIDNKWGQLFSIFGLVFAAEFGDRSFLATIALSAAQNPFSVCGGAIGGHAIATAIAVSGGAYIAKYVSEKVIGYIGGGLFLLFALTTATGIF